MKTIVTSLTVLTGTTISLVMGTNAVLAASFNWSYTTAQGDTYSGMLDGDVGEDGNTINVTSVFMNQLQEVDSSTIIDLPATPIIRDSLGNDDTIGIVSLDKSLIDLGACSAEGCSQGIFISTINDFFSTTSNFGNAFDTPFNPDNWNLVRKPTVPDPSASLALFTLGFFSLVTTCLKKS